MSSLPEAAQKIRQAARAQRDQPETAMSKVQKAATQLEQAAKESSASPPAAARGVTRVQIEKAQFNLNDCLLASTPGLLVAIGQATVVHFITFSLLACGKSFRRKLVKLTGPTFSQKKITVQALDEITQQMQRYLLVQVLISVIVGLATWVVYRVIGVLAFGWLWGVWGLLLGMPALLMVKVVCDHGEDFKPVGELPGK